MKIRFAAEVSPTLNGSQERGVVGESEGHAAVSTAEHAGFIPRGCSP